ncbi:Zn-ribbon domain-containing OB-fold protein [Litorimonas sp.]|uniref:Zn-ribbon domain-containing OB-fold protein n=1 Tax=Litorimonas sp. TaxID=1892381 RepID=UPI003A8B67D9
MVQILPEITPENAPFWQGGKDGNLRIAKCNDCSVYIHPPKNFCPKCHSRSVSSHAVSGQGRIASYTVNYQKWLPDLETPYVVAIVELIEQEGLRFVTRIVDCDPMEIRIGLPVMVTFENHEDVWLPLFKPEEGAPRA